MSELQLQISDFVIKQAGLHSKSRFISLSVLHRHGECRDVIRLRIDGNDANGIVTAKAVFTIGYPQVVGLREGGITGRV